MTTEELYSKRIMPALDELYLRSEHIFGFPEKLSYRDVITHCNRDSEGRYEFPFESFYLSDEEQRAVQKKATKYIRYYWRFPYRTEIVFDDEEIERMKEDLKTMKPGSFEYDMTKEKIDNNDENKRRNAIGDEYIKELEELWRQRDEKELATKDFNAAYDELAKKYGCYKYSAEANTIAFELAFCGPSSNKEYVDELGALFNKAVKGEEYEIQSDNEQKAYCLKDDLRKCLDFYNNYINRRTNGWGKAL